MPNLVTAANSRRTIGAVPVKLKEGYPTGKFDANRSGSATEVYLIDPRNLDALLAEIMPEPAIVDGEVVLTPRFFMPGTTYFAMDSLSFNPQGPGKPCDPFGADPNATAGTYDDIMEVQIDYKINSDSEEQDPEDPQTFLERSRTNSVEFLTFQPNSKLKAGDAEDGEGAEPFKNPKVPIIRQIPLTIWQMDWKRVIAPNFSILDGLAGTVNREAYPWLENAPAETVLFLGAAAKQEYQFAPNGRTIIKPWSLGLRFAVKYIIDPVAAVGDEGDFFAEDVKGWNHVYNPDTQKFQRLFRFQAGGAPRPLYQKSDFNLMFRPASTA